MEECIGEIVCVCASVVFFYSPDGTLPSFTLLLLSLPTSKSHLFHPEDGGSMFSETLVSYHFTTRWQNPEDHNSNLCRRGNFKSCLLYVFNVI